MKSVMFQVSFISSKHNAKEMVELEDAEFENHFEFVSPFTSVANGSSDDTVYCNCCSTWRRTDIDVSSQLMKSVERNLPWESDSCSADQEIARPLLNVKIYYSAHKSPPLGNVLN